MSVQFDPSRNRWVVRWYEGGRQRSRRFHDSPAARRFDAERARASAAARDATTAVIARELVLLRARVDEVERQLPVDARMTGVYPYTTRAGVRWRVAVTHKDRTTTTRRRYQTREAATRARERLAQPDTGARRKSFAAFWRQWLTAKRPYLSDGAIEDLEAHGSKRLLPHLADRPLATLSERDIRAWMTTMIDQRDRRIVCAKTINNARAALSGALGDATRQGLLARNPCVAVAPLPIEHAEPDYLRLDEIDHYLENCKAHYRPLAELLIGTGARISEALALTWPDIDLEHGIVRIERQRARHGDTTTQTKGKRPRSILIGPRLQATLRNHRRAARHPPGEPDWLFICPRPARGRYARRPATNPPSRKTVHEWHERALYRRRSSVEREFGRLTNEWALAPLRVRGLDRVRLRADLTLLAKLACALSRERGIGLMVT